MQHLPHLKGAEKRSPHASMAPEACALSAQRAWNSLHSPLSKEKEFRAPG
ncbi:hypothetical protein T06_9284 [Trichinella sp. T6]|nr:hypothetical protein T06_9284 [Trichinella sp. T6]